MQYHTLKNGGGVFRTLGVPPASPPINNFKNQIFPSENKVKKEDCLGWRYQVKHKVNIHSNINYFLSTTEVNSCYEGKQSALYLPKLLFIRCNLT